MTPASLPLRNLLAVALLVSASAHASTVNITLNGAQEAPIPVFTPGLGSGTFTLNPNNTFSFSITFSGLASGVTIAHIHGAATPIGGAGSGAPGFNAPPMVNIVGGTIPAGITALGGTTGGTFTGTNVSSPVGFLTALSLGQAYFNIHTSQFPNGEIRGNIPAVASVIPLPAPALLMLGGLVVLGAAARRKR